jgi:hypothetical protein
VPDSGYRSGMHGGRPAGRILLAVALVALPLIGLAMLGDGGDAALPASPREAVLRLAPGQGSDAQAVRPAPDGEAGARTAPGARDLGLLAVLLAAAGSLALASSAGRHRPAAVAVRPGPRLRATGRGPPSSSR